MHFLRFDLWPTWDIHHGISQPDPQRPIHNLMAVVVKRLFGCLVVLHNDKCKPLALVGEPVLWQPDTHHLTAVLEETFQVSFLEVVWKVIYEEGVPGNEPEGLL